jgi:hypothetical protein
MMIVTRIDGISCAGAVQCKVVQKDLRQLGLTSGPDVVVHELFDEGMIGEGVLYLLERWRRPPQDGASSSASSSSSASPAGGGTKSKSPVFVPASARLMGQLVELRFEQVQGVNVTLLNPYRPHGRYHSGDTHTARALSEPFLVDQVGQAMSSSSLQPAPSPSYR